jgi:four helix bundle protein
MSEERIIRSFEDLDCWKVAREVREFVRQIVRGLPKEEKYRLGDQLTRASRSITANIAEGYGRFHYLDSSKFFSTARGSTYEVLDHLITAADEGLIDSKVLEQARKLLESAIKLNNGYTKYLKTRAKSES